MSGLISVADGSNFLSKGAIDQFNFLLRSVIVARHEISFTSSTVCYYVAS